MSDRRTTYARAAGYDEAFENALADEIVETIARVSMASDCNVMALRTGETASALLTVLARAGALRQLRGR